MDEVVLHAPAKINWRLRILARRPDGYHELDMYMQAIDLHDTLRMRKSASDTLLINGERALDADRNLVIKAAKALSAYCGLDVCGTFHLTKRIPSMAGLGGGSSDCAQALKGLNLLYGLGLTDTQLSGIALTLGADVPFFLRAGLCRIRGIGEKIVSIPEAPNAHLVIYHVPPGLSTAAVYRRYDEIQTESTCSGLPCEAEDDFMALLRGGQFSALQPVNDLEQPAILLLPEIAAIKRRLTDAGALYTLMSGSGSAVYGVFADAESALRAKATLPGSFTAQTLTDFA